MITIGRCSQKTTSENIFFGFIRLKKGEYYLNLFNRHFQIGLVSGIILLDSGGYISDLAFSLGAVALPSSFLPVKFIKEGLESAFIFDGSAGDG